MKKTIAILLALASIATISLAACKKDKDKNGIDTSGLATLQAPASSTTEKPEEETTTEPVIELEWEDASGNVYVLNPANLRTEPNTYCSTLGWVDFGTELELVATSNGDWYKIKWEGTECYIASWLVTKEKDAITFTTLETPKTVYIIKAETIYVRSTPCWADGFTDNIAGTLSLGDELKQLGVNTKGNYAMVEFVTKDDEDKEVTVKGYINVKYISESAASETESTPAVGG